MTQSAKANTADDNPASKDRALSGDYVRVATPRGGLKVNISKSECEIDTNAESKSSSATSSKSQKKEASANNEDESPTSFRFTQLYRYATTFDYLLLGIGLTTVMVNGALFPLMAIVFGDVLRGFTTTPINQHAINQASLNYLLIAIGMFFTDYISYVTFYHTAERQMMALRGEALKHVLYLDI
ncbi:Multidrug resistance protein abc superfamily, partial [Globisporangium polare]